MIGALAKLARSYWDAIVRLQYDYGLPLAGAVSFSTILALFPFLIFATALAGFLGGYQAAEEAVAELFEILPAPVAETLAPEVRRVMSTRRGDLLTVGILFTIVFSAAGVESLRTALNNAYRVDETRGTMFRWLQSCLFVLAAAAAMLVAGVAMVVLPLARDRAIALLPGLEQYVRIFADLGLIVALVVAVLMLAALHFWLPDGRRRVADIWPGVANTVVLWAIAAYGFGAYIARFNYYAATYAGLANAMIALVFFYICAVIFVFGAELNRAYIEDRARRGKTDRGPVPKDSPEPTVARRPAHPSSARRKSGGR